MCDTAENYQADAVGSFRMLNLRICLLFFFAFLTTAVRADEPDLPSPPDGFDWQWCDEVRVGILKPQQWHFLSQSKGETRGYFITKEKILGAGEFRTGLTLNVIPNVGKKRGKVASDFAKSYIREAIRDKQSVLRIIPPAEAGPAKVFGCRIRKEGSVIHYFLIADDTRDVLYLFMFESPEAEWESEWNAGETMLQKLYVDFPDE